ncbi:MAG TPA: hypothetical protein VG267_17835 [Terracidiphilus sp.]|nr:hypothetical protein [Terracidiphilus sp.]
MTLYTEKLIAALKNTLWELELTEAPGRDQESFTELKRIVNHRIQDLETGPASLPNIPRPERSGKID